MYFLGDVWRRFDGGTLVIMPRIFGTSFTHNPRVVTIMIDFWSPI